MRNDFAFIDTFLFNKVSVYLFVDVFWRKWCHIGSFKYSHASKSDIKLISQNWWSWLRYILCFYHPTFTLIFFSFSNPLSFNSFLYLSFLHNYYNRLTSHASGMLHFVVSFVTTTIAWARIFLFTGLKAFPQALRGNCHVLA